MQRVVDETRRNVEDAAVDILVLVAPRTCVYAVLPFACHNLHTDCNASAVVVAASAASVVVAAIYWSPLLFSFETEQEVEIQAEIQE